MNANIQKLYAIAGKPRRTIIGLMSGTSFDGLDVALCVFTGAGRDTVLELKQFTTLPYEPAFKEELKSVFAKRQADLEKVTLLNAFIGKYYAQLIKTCLTAWGVAAEEIDLIASHGQSVFHSPKHQRSAADGYGNATLQIGDGDHLAVDTGIIVLSDFRQKHIAAGGEGAPLAVYGDHILFSDRRENRIMLNIGGIANFTYLPADDRMAIFSTDVGPGNTLMDQFVQARFPGLYYDKDSAIASKGEVNHALLKALFEHPFFAAGFPKTTGPELFNLSYLQAALERVGLTELSVYDVMATLAAFSAQGIIRAMEATLRGRRDFEIYFSGGGIYNPLLVRQLEAHFRKALRSTAELDVNPDAKEAVLFALLANEAVAGEDGTGIYMGKVSFPL